MGKNSSWHAAHPVEVMRHLRSRTVSRPVFARARSPAPQWPAWGSGNSGASRSFSAIAGCTEIPVVITNEDDSPLPFVDTTRLLAKKAFEFAATISYV